MLSFYLISLCKWLYFCCYKKARARSLKLAMEIYISCSFLLYVSYIKFHAIGNHTQKAHIRGQRYALLRTSCMFFLLSLNTLQYYEIYCRLKSLIFFISSSTDVSAIPLVILNKMADTSLSLAGFTPGMLKKSRIPNMHPKSKTFKIVLHIFVYQNSPYEQKRILQDLYHFYIVIKTFFSRGITIMKFEGKKS